MATNSLINPNLPAFPNTPLPAGDKGDPAKAKELLQASGLTLPVKIAVTYRKSDDLDKVFAGLKVGWDAAGFDVRAGRRSSAKTYYGTLQAPEAASKYDVYWAGWGADYPSASTVIPPLFDSRINVTVRWPGSGLRLLRDPAFHAKIDETNKIADMTEREKAWGDLDTEICTK